MKSIQRSIKYRYVYITVASIILFICTGTLSALSYEEKNLPEKKTLVYKLNIKEDIGPAIWRQTKQAFREAEELKADIIIIHMNTYGGLLNDADSIRTTILNSAIPVYVFIDNNAASAGALISIACDSIYMSKGASIGAATVVDQSGNVVPDKYQSYMRSKMRATAEAHGKDTIISGNDTIIKWFRDPAIAEAMVDQSIYVQGISDTGKVLTFSSDEAIIHGYCEGIAKNIHDVLDLTGTVNYEIREYVPSGLESVIGFLVNPFVSGILIMIIIGGIYFELQTPGIGFPLGAAIIAAVLYFAPLYLEGLAENWEVLIFVVGIILVGLEIFVIPGFGVAGISGIILIVIGLTLSMTDNIVFDPSNNYTGGFESVIKAFFVVIVSILTSFILSLYLSKKLFTSTAGPFKDFALNKTQKKEEGYIGVEGKQHSLIGKTGIAATVLRPSGRIMVENEIYDAVAETGYIEKGTNIKVVKFITGQLYVNKI